MKRSEMLDEITFILDREWDLSHPSKSEVILSKLEDLGMKYTTYFPHEGYCEEPWDEEDV